MKYCSHPGLGPLLPPNPFLIPPALKTAPNSRKSCSEVLASINHISTPQPLPAEHRGRNIIPFPFPRPPSALPDSSDCLMQRRLAVENFLTILPQPQQISLSATHCAHGSLWPICHTTVASESCCFNQSPYLLVFLHVFTLL